MVQEDPVKYCSAWIQQEFYKIFSLETDFYKNGDDKTLQERGLNDLLRTYDVNKLE